MLRKMATSFLVACLLVSAFVGIYKAFAGNGEANVYIIQLDGVSGWWVNDTNAVSRGAIAACTPCGEYIEENLPRVHPKLNVGYPPYYNAIPKVVTTWSEYKSIIESYVGAIVVNTHGEYLPVPSGYTNQAWVDKIAEAMLTRGLTWVHCGGYTFYRVWKEAIGDQGEWTEKNPNNVTIGAGFRRLMNQTNLDNVDLWPAPGTENDRLTVSPDNVLQNFKWKYAWDFEAEIGRPLKYDDFSQYVTMSIFGPWTDTNTGTTYYPGAVISFSKTNQRSMQNNASGAYVHIGVNGFKCNVPGNSSWMDADYGRGFIGTAAALFTESLSFRGQANSMSHIVSPWGLYPVNATCFVNPLVSYIRQEGSDMHVRIIFGIYGAMQSFIDTPSSFSDVWFEIDQPPDEWSNANMKVDLDNSREGNTSGLRINGLQNPASGGDLSLLAGGAMWLLGAPGLISGPGAWILFLLKGVQLFAQFFRQGLSTNTSGVGVFAPYIDFKYLPLVTDTYKDYADQGTLHYQEFVTFTAVELEIPVARTPGWRTLPLTYRVYAEPLWFPGAIPDRFLVNDTLNLAIWIEGNAGQDDAGTGADAGNTITTATNITSPRGFYGYLNDPTGTDIQDWYSFNVNATGSVTIDFSMIPPPYVDFGIKLYDPSNTPVSVCDNGPGSTDYLLNYTGVSGYWKVEAYSVTGSGVYSCSLSIRTSDINRDGLVDIYDAIILAGAFGTSMNSTRWNKAADLNGDNTVDIYDAIILANHYGQCMGGSGKSAQSGGPKVGPATAGGASVLVDPSSVTVFKGEVFTVNVKVTSVTDLRGWEFKLYWNSTLLNCTNFVIQSPTEWQGNAHNYGEGLEAGYNATHARLWVAQAANYPAPSFNGSMTIATLTFQALQTGTTPLTLADTNLGNSTAQPIDHADSSGSVSVYYGRYMRSDTKTVNGLNAYLLNATRTTSSLYQSANANGQEPVTWGIRAWVRHSNGAEQEITLDGQTGTPKAQVSRSSGYGMQSNTVSVTQRSLQATDSLVVRVYMDIGGGGWTQAAAFTTEQLGATTLTGTTWTVYYYTSATYNGITDKTYGRYYWGSPAYDSRIQNLQYG